MEDPKRLARPSKTMITMMMIMDQERCNLRREKHVIAIILRSRESEWFVLFSIRACCHRRSGYLTWYNNNIITLQEMKYGIRFADDYERAAWLPSDLFSATDANVLKSIPKTFLLLLVVIVALNILSFFSYGSFLTH